MLYALICDRMGKDKVFKFKLKSDIKEENVRLNLVGALIRAMIGGVQPSHGW